MHKAVTRGRVISPRFLNHTTSKGRGSYSLLLLGHAPLIALLSVQESAHTWVCADLNPGPPRAQGGSLGSPPAPVARRCPCGSPIRGAPTPRCLSRSRLPDAPPTRDSVTWRLFIFLRSPKMSKPDAGRCDPTAPARTMPGSLGAEAARGLRASQTAAEHRPSPRPTALPAT